MDAGDLNAWCGGQDWCRLRRGVQEQLLRKASLLQRLVSLTSLEWLGKLDWCNRIFGILVWSNVFTLAWDPGSAYWCGLPRREPWQDSACHLLGMGPRTLQTARSIKASSKKEFRSLSDPPRSFLFILCIAHSSSSKVNMPMTIAVQKHDDDDETLITPGLSQHLKCAGRVSSDLWFWQRFDLWDYAVWCCRSYEQVIAENAEPKKGSQKLSFDRRYAQSLWKQYTTNVWRFRQTYWRTVEYNAVRYLLTVLIGVAFGYCASSSLGLHAWISDPCILK